jgi:hypothetical protein
MSHADMPAPTLPPRARLCDAPVAGRFGFIGILAVMLTLPYAVPALLDAVLARFQLPRDAYLLRPVENQFFHLQFAAVAVGLPYALWRIMAPPAGRLPRNSLVWLATAFVVFQAVSLFAAPNMLFSVRQIAAPVLAWVLFLVLVTSGASGRAGAEKLLLVAVVGLIPAAVYAVAQSQGYEFLPYSKFVSEDTLDEIEGKQLISSTFGHPNYMASYLAPLLFWALYFAFSQGGGGLVRWVGRVAALAVVAALITGGTRGAWLAVVVAAVPLYLLLTLSPAYRRQLLFAGGVGLLAIAAILFIPNPLVRIQFDLTDRLLASKEIASRLYYWLIALEMFRAHPLTGVGYGQYNLLFWDYVNLFQQSDDGAFYEFVLTDIVRGVPPGFTHNDYLQFAAEGGVAVVGAWLALWSALLCQGWETARAAARTGDARGHLMASAFTAAFAAMAVDALFNFPFHIPVSLFLFWAMLGAWVLFRADSQRRTEKPDGVASVRVSPPNKPLAGRVARS